jgi:hypothetical protein
MVRPDQAGQAAKALRRWVVFRFTQAEGYGAMSTYQIRIDVEVYDLSELRAYALKRCHEAGMNVTEFETGEHDDPEANVTYWLGWAFDSGSPVNAGFRIDDSETIFCDA